MKILMNKKAEIKSHVIKIILAVLSLIVLIAFAVILYQTFTKSSDLEKAQKNLDLLAEKINAFKPSDKTEDKVIIFPPANWYLVSYDVIQKQGHPEGVCVGDKYCLCICNSNQCDKSIVCRGFGFGVEVDNMNKLLANSNYIMYLSSVEEFVLSKEDNKIKIIKKIRRKFIATTERIDTFLNKKAGEILNNNDNREVKEILSRVLNNCNYREISVTPSGKKAQGRIIKTEEDSKLRDYASEVIRAYNAQIGKGLQGPIYLFTEISSASGVQSHEHGGLNSPGVWDIVLEKVDLSDSEVKTICDGEFTAKLFFRV